MGLSQKSRVGNHLEDGLGIGSGDMDVGGVESNWSIDNLRSEMAYVRSDELYSSRPEKTQPSFGHALYTYISRVRFWHLGWIKHVFHIWSSFDRIGEGVELKKGDIKMKIKRETTHPDT